MSGGQHFKRESVVPPKMTFQKVRGRYVKRLEPRLIGINWCPSEWAWTVTMPCEGGSKRIGRYRTRDEAIAARAAAMNERDAKQFAEAAASLDSFGEFRRGRV